MTHWHKKLYGTRVKMAHVGITRILQAREFVGTHVIISLSTLKHTYSTSETKCVCEVVVGLYRMSVLVPYCHYMLAGTLREMFVES